MLESAELLNGPRRPELFAHWKTANGAGKQRLFQGLSSAPFRHSERDH